jgi:hypothetical protein
LSRVSEVGFYPLPLGFFPQVAGKIFFFPRYDSYHRSSTEARRREVGDHMVIISGSSNSSGSDPLPRHRPSPGVDALCTVASLRPHQPSPPSAPLHSNRHSRHSVRFYHITVDAMPSSPNCIFRGAGRTKEGKQVKPTAHCAQGLRLTKRSFSRDDRLAQDGARMHTGSNSRSLMVVSSPPPARVADSNRFMLPTARVG